MELTTAAAVVAFVVVIIGSLAPWVTTPLTSAAGTSGDGVISIVLAVVGLVLLFVLRGTARAVAVAVVGAAIVALGIYEVIHIHNTVVHVPHLLPLLAAHVGWGVYAVAIAGLVAVGAAVWSLTSTR